MLKEYIEKNKNNTELYSNSIDNIVYIFAKNMINLNIWEKVIKQKLIKKENLDQYLVKIKLDAEKTYDYLLFTGNILVNYNDESYFIPLNDIKTRGIEESALDPANILSSRDGFNESITINRTLIKKRLKKTNLKIDSIIMGENTLTDINIIYIENKIDNKNLIELKKKLLTYPNNDIISINDLIKIIGNDDIVPCYETTGNPEVFANAILAGRIGILIDNTPIAIIIPTTLLQFTETENDINGIKISTIFNRMFVLLFMFTSIFVLGLFVVLTSHHPEVLPTIFIANFQLTERGTAFPLILEIIVVLILFEFYRIMSMRSSMSFVQNIVILFGGLFIGQNVIDASLVGSFSIIIASISFVSTFAITNNPNLITAFSIFRFFILIMSFFLGLVGFLISSIVVIDYLSNIRKFNKGYLNPFIPIIFEKIKRWIIPRKE